MKTSSLETVLGALVLIVAVVFLIYSASVGDVETVKGYKVIARFNQAGALQVGDDVRLSGVKIGTVNAITLTKEDYLASVEAVIDENVKLPVDTSASVASTSLLGGSFLDLSPGGDDVMLSDGGIIQFTQDAQNIEKLLGQFIFSVKDAKATESESPADAQDSLPAADDTALPAM